MSDKVLLMVGTKKGAFLFLSDKQRQKWEAHGPFFAGSPIYHLACDQRGGGPAGDGPQIYAAINSRVWGPEIAVSGDMGSNWQSIGAPKYPADSGLKVKRVWHLEPGLHSQPGVLYAGVEPAGLFVSRDGGLNWEGVDGLNRHDSRDKWQPGLGGLCLHTIILHPSDSKRMWAGISAAGVFRTEDGGKTWMLANKGVRADFLPDKYPEVGQCVHKMAINSKEPQVLYQQNHCGMYRSADGGVTWDEMTGGLPSTFGFPLAVHPEDTDTVYLVPLESDGNRVPPGGLAVYRTKDGGQTWEAHRKGLPQPSYVNVLREGMTIDSLDPAGIYVGCQDGSIFASQDDGDSWHELARYLPPVLSVSCAII